MISCWSKIRRACAGCENQIWNHYRPPLTRWRLPVLPGRWKTPLQSRLKHVLGPQTWSANEISPSDVARFHVKPHPDRSNDQLEPHRTRNGPRPTLWRAHWPSPHASRPGAIRNQAVQRPFNALKSPWPLAYGIFLALDLTFNPTRASCIACSRASRGLIMPK